MRKVSTKLERKQMPRTQSAKRNLGIGPGVKLLCRRHALKSNGQEMRPKSIQVGPRVETQGTGAVVLVGQVSKGKVQLISKAQPTKDSVRGQGSRLLLQEGGQDRYRIQVYFAAEFSESILW